MTEAEFQQLADKVNAISDAMLDIKNRELALAHGKQLADHYEKMIEIYRKNEGDLDLMTSLDFLLFNNSLSICNVILLQTGRSLA